MNDLNSVPDRCPFCQSTHTSVFESDVGRWAVSCSTCRAIGPSASSVAKAIERWHAAHRAGPGLMGGK